MFRNSVFMTAMGMAAVVVVWGMVDTPSLAMFANDTVSVLLKSRGWFVMLTVSFLLFSCFGLALSRYGGIRLGRDDDRPEFATFTWLNMMFAAGMGVGLLFYGVAEPLLHYEFISQSTKPNVAMGQALTLTIFHWGLHAWAIYGVGGLVIAYFGFRLGRPKTISAPIYTVFGRGPVARVTGWWVDVMALYAIAIGLSGSIAMGVFQVQSGLSRLLGIQDAGMALSLGIFACLVAAYILPLLRDLGEGMAMLSNLAMAVTVGLIVFFLLFGPTAFLMGTVTETLGQYIGSVIPQGFFIFTFWGDSVREWFTNWTLNYMVWWLAWAPFVGVFLARISKGRTIREYILGVLLVPTGFSTLWFGVMGGLGAYQSYLGHYDHTVASTDINAATFALLETLPLHQLTIVATIIAAFLFIVTSVVSASFVLAMFTAGGDENPPTRLKVVWGVILGALGLVMIITDSVDAVRAIIALSANPFVFIITLMMVCLFVALKAEKE
nr:BCCT family transporter [uncultured Desulfobacter sp.]